MGVQIFTICPHCQRIEPIQSELSLRKIGKLTALGILLSNFFRLSEKAKHIETLLDRLDGLKETEEVLYCPACKNGSTSEDLAKFGSIKIIRSLYEWYLRCEHCIFVIEDDARFPGLERIENLFSEKFGVPKKRFTYRPWTKDSIVVWISTRLPLYLENEILNFADKFDKYWKEERLITNLIDI